MDGISAAISELSYITDAPPERGQDEARNEQGVVSWG